MYPQRKEKTSDIALAALHREMVSRVYQLEELAARCDALGQYEKAAHHLSLSEEVIAGFVELKRRMM
jgi:hypothetical protein